MKTGPIDFGPAKCLLQRFLHDKSGATVIEYGLIVALIGTIIIVGIGGLGETMRDDVFGAIVAALESALSGGEDS